MTTDKFYVWLPALLALAGALFLGAWTALRIRSWLDRRRRLRISRRAETGEARARSWLGKNGFTIVGEQESLICEMHVDGERVEYEVCADFVVERNGERAVVEVKTGGAARPSSPATRRQIFEYAAAYGVDRAYMFDGDRATLHEMVFQIAPRGYERRVRWVAGWKIGFVGGVVCAAAVVWLVARCAS